MNYRKLAKPWSRARSLCRKCGVNVNKRGEYYMLRNEVWQEGIERGQVPIDKYGQAGMLCIGCFEELLGRQLTRADFSDHWQEKAKAFLDDLIPMDGHISDRLYDRLTTEAA